MVCRLSYATMLSFFFVILQTSVFRCFFYFSSHCDLLTAFIIFLGVHRPLKESVSVSLISGLIMDTIIGNVSGVYSLLYIWIALVSKIMVGYVHSDNRMSKFIIIATLIAFVNISLPLLEYSILFKGDLKSVIFVLKLQLSTLLLDIVWSMLGMIVFIIVFYFAMMMLNKKRRTHIITVKHKYS